MVLLVLFGVLFSAMAIGVPVAISLILSGTVPMLIFTEFDAVIIAQKFIDATDNYVMMAAPFFILAGELMNRAGVTQRLIDFVMSIVGHVRGGLGYVAIVTCTIFAGLSGSAVADAAAVGTALVPIMEKKGYDRKLATGLIMSSSIVGPVIPPSIVFIVFGVVTGTSIIKLFMAGIIPGLMISGGVAITWYFVSKTQNVIPERKHSPKEALKLGYQSIWSLILPIIIIGGLRLGFFTPTEASIGAVYYTLFIGVVIYKALSWKDIYDSLRISIETTCILMFIMGSAGVTSYFITTSNVADSLLSLFMMINSPTLIMVAIVVLLFACGMILDATPVILIFAPILMPVVTEMGIDPVYFGIIFSVAIILGFLTPPVGLGIFTGMRIGKFGMSEMMEGIWPFLKVIIAVVMLLTLFPSIITVPLSWMF